MTTAPQAWFMFTVGLAQVALLLALAPVLSGMSRVLRAKFHTRRGPGVLQDYRDLLKLFQRAEVIPPEAGIVFRSAPYVFMVALLLAAFALPALMLDSPVGAVGDLFVFIYVLALARFFLALSGIDSGNMYAGLGASRETTIAVLNEPVMLLSLFVAALSTGSTNLGTMARELAFGHTASMAATGLAALAFAFSAFVEMGKLPFDFAEAEQELQEGPLTEYSGRALALMKWGIYLRQAVMAAIFIGVFLPFGAARELAPLPLLWAVLWFCVKLVVIFAGISLVENSMARMRFLDSSRVILVAVGAAVLAFAFSLAGV
ncbi:respiratory chain complex I subunit 1 family protein [Burkholderia multivorans]|uniref:respiratory chain complex I subunit 1 family protein n=1 Tax=Burkholderia multivorans TaxID=87883 RepID=UPI0015E39DE3|nr:NADH-quinone oxidoreductase subunit H [Burkholderia multivorans]